MCTQTAALGDSVSVRFENPKQEIEKPGKDPDKDPDAPRRIGMLAEKYGVEALFISEDGNISMTKGMQEYFTEQTK